MPHSQGLSNNPYPEPNQPNYPHIYPCLTLSSHLRLGLPKGFFPVGLPVKILKAFLPSSLLATCPAHLNFLDLITHTILGAFCTPHSHPYWAQILCNILLIILLFNFWSNLRLVVDEVTLYRDMDRTRGHAIVCGGGGRGAETLAGNNAAQDKDKGHGNCSTGI